MLKLIAVLVTVFVLLTGCVMQPAPADDAGVSYDPPAPVGRVYMVDAVGVTEYGTVFFTDENGDIWVYYLSLGERPVNQHVILVIHDNYTPGFVHDDIILEWR